MTVFDVTIVGAGPAGSALAAHLARDGYAVLLLERERFPRDKVCGDLVSAKALKLLADLGCYGEIKRRGYVPIQESAVYLDDEFLIKAPIPRIAEYPPFGHAIPRLELDELILSAALAGGAQVIEACTVLDCQVGPTHVVVDAAVGHERRRFRSRIVVGADGASSTIARCAGLDMRDPRYVQLAIRAYCRGMPLEHAVLVFAEDFFPGYGWIFPVNDSVANIGVGMVKESVQKDGIRLKRFYSQFAAFVRNMALEMNAEIELTRPMGWPIKTYGGANRNYFERGLLIGDAGCFVDPISGEGIPFALETAGMAAATIREAFAKNDFGVAAMSQFERRWRSVYDADLGVSDLVVSAIRNRHLVKFWIHGLRVMGLTAAQDRKYALKVGGILAGLVPNREGFSPEIVLKSVMHGPAFWMRALDLTPDNLAGDVVRKGTELLKWQTQLASAMMTDFDWFSDWALEIGSKQIRVLNTLISPGKRHSA